MSIRQFTAKNSSKLTKIDKNHPHVSPKSQKRSGGCLELKEGTLYPILHQLEKTGAIKARWEEAEGTRKRKFYGITAEGRKQLARRKREWLDFRTIIDGLIDLRGVI